MRTSRDTQYSLISAMKWPTLVSFVAFFAIAITQVHSEKARYDFYRVYKVSVRNEVHLSVMQQIYDYPDGVSETSLIFCSKFKFSFARFSTSFSTRSLRLSAEIRS